MTQSTGHSASLDFPQPEPVDLSSGKYVKLWQGPQHPGITGNMSLELVLDGDTIIECKTHVGYLHRGFEKLMERRTYIQNFTVVCRIAVPEPTFNEYLYSHAVELLSGIEVPERAIWLRTMNLELMRLAIPRRTYTQSHLDFIAESAAKIKSRASKIRGYKFTYAPELLRHFTARFEPL